MGKNNNGEKFDKMIDAYFNGKMSKAEKASFEEQMSQCMELKDEFENRYSKNERIDIIADTKRTSHHWIVWSLFVLLLISSAVAVYFMLYKKTSATDDESINNIVYANAKMAEINTSKYEEKLDGKCDTLFALLDGALIEAKNSADNNALSDITELNAIYTASIQELPDEEKKVMTDIRNEAFYLKALIIFRSGKKTEAMQILQEISAQHVKANDILAEISQK